MLTLARVGVDIWIVRQLKWLTVPSRIRLASSRLIEAMNLRG